MNTLFKALVEQWMPRILTQACRDPNSEAYGCFDRNWWHYKMRDFPSIILQQGGYTTWLMQPTRPRSSTSATTKDIEDLSPVAAVGDRGRFGQDILPLAKASCLFWNERALRRGAFEEYYPWEQGYPPLAFSTLAVMKLVHEGVTDKKDVEAGAQKAAAQLLHRFESQAANQQVAGLAALAWLKKNYSDLVPQNEFLRIKNKTLALQSDEGWFEEYGGPDLGYLSVTIDCLWDLYDATGDADYIQSAAKALEFIASFANLAGANIGMHNARNTDYIVPYGIARFVKDSKEYKTLAASVLFSLYNNIQDPTHFFHATDDRYLCHYIGHSVLRAHQILNGITETEIPTPTDTEKVFKKSGHYLQQTNGRTVIISFNKGGILSILKKGQWASDFGWVIKMGDQQFINHGWSSTWTWNRDQNTFFIKGHLIPHRETTSTPIKHFLLRVASYTFGPSLIKKLKQKMIFQTKKSPYFFERKIVIESNELRVMDSISDLSSHAEILPAPRSSKRHVASADSFHPEDFNLCHEINMKQTEHFQSGKFTAETIYQWD